MLVLRVFRAVLGTAGGLAIAQAVNLSYGGKHEPVTYAAWYVLGVLLLLAALVFWIAIHRRHTAESQETSLVRSRKIKDEIGHIQHRLIQLTAQRDMTGSTWPLKERPYQILPAEKWNVYGTSLGLSEADHETVANAYELANDFNHEMLAGEGNLDGPEPPLDALREAFDRASAVLDVMNRSPERRRVGVKLRGSRLGGKHVRIENQSTGIDADLDSDVDPDDLIIK
jgi:hypothetical protein